MPEESQVYVEFTGTIRPTADNCKPGRALDEEVRRITRASVSMCSSPSRSFDEAMYALNRIVGPIGHKKFAVNEVILSCSHTGWWCTLRKLDEESLVTSATTICTNTCTGPHAICKAILRLNEMLERGEWSVSQP